MRYLLVGDLHLDLHRRFEDTVSLLHYIADLAFDYKVDKVLQLGDAYESRRPYQQEMRALETWAKRIADRGIDVVFIEGNHDLTGGTSALGEFKILNIPGIHVYGSPHIEDDIFMGHFGLAESSMGPLDFHIPNQMLLRDFLVSYPGCSLYALGHIHKPQFMHQNPTVFHTGSIDRTDFGELGEDKFVYFAETGGDGQVHTLDSIKLPLRPMIQINMKATASFPVGDYKDSIVKVIVSGTRNELKNFDEASIRGQLVNAYSLSVSYDIERPKTVREDREVIKEGVTAQKALEEYVKTLKIGDELEKKVLEKGIEVIGG